MKPQINRLKVGDLVEVRWYFGQQEPREWVRGRIIYVDDFFFAWKALEGEDGGVTPWRVTDRWRRVETA